MSRLSLKSGTSGLLAAAVLAAGVFVGVAGASSKPPAVSVANASAGQDADSIVFTVRLSRSTSKRVTVRYATADGTATAGSDYSAVRGRLVFKARALLTGTPGQGTGEFTMILDPVKREASFAITVAGLREDPGVGHIHSAKDSALALTIHPLPPKDGST